MRVDHAWTADEQRRRDRRWSVALAVLAVAGSWSFVRVPRPRLRGHWDTSVGWMVVLALCGTVAGAIWHGRPYARTAAWWFTWAMVVTWALVLTAPRPWAVPGVSLPVLGVMTLLIVPLRVYVAEPM